MVKAKQKQQRQHLEGQRLQAAPPAEGRLEKTGFVNWIYLWGILAAVVSVIVAAIWGITFYSFPSNSQGHLKTRGQFGVPPVYKRGTVKQGTLPSPHSSFARECAKNGVPVVLRNSITKTWKASKKWSPSYLKSKLKKVAGVYENENRWFGPYFDRSKPLIETAIRQNPYKTGINMTSDEFFDVLLHPRENKHQYYTGSIDDLGDWAYKEVQPLDELLLLNPKLSSINVWIGQPHLIAHCHYDGYHNFYAQLYGTKKFTLFAPSNWPGLYPYPFLHPSHAQAQVNASDEASVDQFPLVKRVEAVQAVLEPGDLLYMPPLWFHEVESQSMSISVNVWTDSHQTELMTKIFLLPLPFDSIEKPHRHKHAQWTSDQERLIGTAILIHRILVKVCSFRKCMDNTKFLTPHTVPVLNNYRQSALFVYQLWSTRYRTLMVKGELPLEVPNGASILCENNTAEVREVAIRVDLDITEDIHYGAYVEQIGYLVRGLPEQTWQLWMGNFIESVAYQVVRDPQYVGLYLRHLNSCVTFL